jgi:predicted O-linked N-acetylglucosamine transferase (SPINDLY family)
VQNHRTGELPAAIELYRRAAALRPQSSAVQNNLALACKEAGDAESALAAARTAVALAPANPGLWTNLGNLYRDLGNLDDAVAAYRRTLSLDPSSVPALNNLGIALHDAGRVEEAVSHYRRAIEIDPAAVMAHSNLLYAMHFDPRYDAASIFREHRLWAARHADPLTATAPPHDNDPNPDRPLRIGYVSAYLQDHVVGRFMLPLLQAHDREGFQTFCYADESGPRDAVTEKLAAASHTWRNIRGQGDQHVAQLVRNDRIDILVDLGMHMSGSRLLVFARKPAPVQVTYLAYCSTTGLSAIDYRLTDPHLDPPSTDPDYSEKSVRLPESWWCYRPPEGAGDPGPLPAAGNDRVVTFASLNSFAKVTPHALETWACILQNVPRSRLLLHAREGAHRRRVLDLFAAGRIDPTRIEFTGFVPLTRYFDLYRRADIALDPFPYAGGATTCDALWAGVPVVTLAGQTAVGRGGASILSNVGAQDLIAATEDAYVRIASDLASDVPRTAGLRRSLRPRMQSSSLTNDSRFAGNVETAFRQMWRSWCTSSRVTSAGSGL